MTVDSFEVVYYTSIFILPGFLIKSIINSMTPKVKTSDSIYFLSCLSYSIVNCAIWSWMYNILYQNRDILTFWYWIFVVLSTLIGATLLAIILGYIKQKELISRLVNRTKVNYIHPVPTAWDYYFSKQKSAWVIVTLMDGSKVYGHFDNQSFASSDREERDIYIQEVYGIDEKYNWIKNGQSDGIMISKNNIKTIEFIK